jgi:hypothetical protein
MKKDFLFAYIQGKWSEIEEGIMDKDTEFLLH